jgi:hypothetical protein
MNKNDIKKIIEDLQEEIAFHWMGIEDWTINRIEKNKPDILVSEIPEALDNIYEMAEFGEDSELHAYDLGVIDTLKGFDKVLRDLKNKIIDLS